MGFFSKNELIYQPVDEPRLPDNVINFLPVGIYVLKASMDLGLYLEKKQEDEFVLPSKIYGSDEKWVDKVLKTWGAISNNLGVLLSGNKGTGKTITSKILGNKCGLPIIILDTNFGINLSHFMEQIQQDVCIFIDEFEKIFLQDNSHIAPLLTMMDGASQSIYKRMFILTTNSNDVNSHLIDRPGRIRYHKKYKNLSLELIREILNDLLIDKTIVEQVTESISRLDLITMDVLVKIVEEVNIHSELPDDFLDYFNVTISEPFFMLDLIKNEESPVELGFSSKVYRQSNGETYYDGQYYGKSKTGWNKSNEIVITADNGDIIKFVRRQTIGRNEAFVGSYYL